MEFIPMQKNINFSQINTKSCKLYIYYTYIQYLFISYTHT